jgi:hypothetical protein
VWPRRPSLGVEDLQQLPDIRGLSGLIARVTAPKAPRPAVVVPFDDRVTTAAQVGSPAVGGAPELGDRSALSLRRCLRHEGADVFVEPAGQLDRPIASVSGDDVEG